MIWLQVEELRPHDFSQILGDFLGLKAALDPYTAACGSTDKCEIKATILRGTPRGRDIPGGSVTVSVLNEMHIVNIINPPYKHECGPDGTCPNVNIYHFINISPFNAVAVAERN